MKYGYCGTISLQCERHSLHETHLGVKLKEEKWAWKSPKKVLMAWVKFLGPAVCSSPLFWNSCSQWTNVLLKLFFINPVCGESLSFASKVHLKTVILKVWLPDDYHQFTWELAFNLCFPLISSALTHLSPNPVASLQNHFNHEFIIYFFLL